MAKKKQSMLPAALIIGLVLAGYFIYSGGFGGKATTGGSEADVSVSFYDALGNRITTSDTMAVYRVNSVEGVSSMKVNGKICANANIYIAGIGASSNTIINGAIANSAQSAQFYATYAPGMTVGQKTLASPLETTKNIRVGYLTPGQCSNFETNIIDVSNIGEGIHSLSFKAEAYKQFICTEGVVIGSSGGVPVYGACASGTASELSDTKSSNTITLDITQTAGDLGDIIISYA